MIDNAILEVGFKAESYYYFYWNKIFNMTLREINNKGRYDVNFSGIEKRSE